MSVYIEKRKIKYGHMLVSYMMADTLKDLHAMASKLNINRERFFDTKVPHYRLLQSQKERAIDGGVVLVDNKESAQIAKKWREKRKGSKTKRKTTRKTQAKKTLEAGEWINRGAMWITISLICEFQNHWIKVIIVGFIEHWRRYYAG